MKKILTSVFALALCGVMLTACGNDQPAAETETEATTTVSVTAEETKAAEAEETEKETEAETTAAETEAETEAETTAAETEAETEAETAAAAKSSYSSIDEFSKSGEAFDLATKEIPAGDSLTYNFVKTLEGADSLYLDVESPDGTMTMVMGMSNTGVYLQMHDPSSDTDMTIIVKSDMMYMLDDATKTGYYMAADENMLADYDFDSIMSEMNIDKEIAEADDVKVCTVEIDGKDYTFEVADTGGGFLFDKDEKLCAILSNDTTSDLTALIVNDFSGEAPASIFEVPSDYTLVDLSAALGE